MLTNNNHNGIIAVGIYDIDVHEFITSMFDKYTFLERRALLLIYQKEEQFQKEWIKMNLKK